MEYRNPLPTVDIIIEYRGGFIMIKRKYEPLGWALPGGFVDYGESLEAAAVREALEETSLRVTLQRQLHTYSDPSRDARKHTISTVYVAQGEGELRAADDAAEAMVVTAQSLPEPIVFDHADIIRDYLTGRY